VIADRPTLSDARCYPKSYISDFHCHVRFVPEAEVLSPAKHAAIVTSADTMVHAHDGAAVAEVTIAPWWRRRLAYAFRFPGVA
jgi:hypothetical protein